MKVIAPQDLNVQNMQSLLHLHADVYTMSADKYGRDALHLQSTGIHLINVHTSYFYFFKVLCSYSQQSPLCWFLCWWDEQFHFVCCHPPLFL